MFLARKVLGEKEVVVSRPLEVDQDFGLLKEADEPETKKVRLNLSRFARGCLKAPFLATIRVNRAGYVPNYVTPRAKIGPELFTAVVEPSAIELLEQDPRVVSVSPSQLLRPG
jgi:hypothetical protein